MEEIVTILSTREWAITIWGTGFFIWMLTQSEIRKSLWNVIKILLGKNLRRFFLIIALYVAGITMIFYQLPFWNNIYLKDIILWLIFSGISYCVNSIIKGDTEHTLDKEWSIGADLIYEYFSALFKKDVVNEFIHNIWLSAEYAIDKCDTEDQRKIVKALAVILIVNKEDEIPATEKYLKLCINASDPEQALMELKKKEFIYKKNSTDSYVFKTRAGSELKAEIKRQRELKGENVNYSKVLLDVTGNYFIIPRKYNTVKMMTRYFTNEFMSVDDFLNITSSTALLDNTLDGKVITLYSFSRIKD